MSWHPEAASETTQTRVKACTTLSKDVRACRTCRRRARTCGNLLQGRMGRWHVYEAPRVILMQ